MMCSNIDIQKSILFGLFYLTIKYIENNFQVKKNNLPYNHDFIIIPNFN